MPNSNAILIDPAAQCVSIVTLDLANLHPMKQLIGCEWIEHVTLQSGPVRLDGWVDEQGLLKDWDEQHFFGFANIRGMTITGRMLVTSSNEDGDTVGFDNAQATAILLRLGAAVSWIERHDVRIPAPRINGRLINPDVEWWTYEERLPASLTAGTTASAACAAKEGENAHARCSRTLRNC